MNTNELVDSDPFFATGGLGAGEKTNFQNALDNYELVNGSNLDIFEFVAYIYQCGNWYGNDVSSCPGLSTSFSTLMGSGIPQIDKDNMWQQVIGLYSSVKQEFQQKVMQEQAILGGCYNGCIGNPSFNVFMFDFFSFG